MGYSMSLYLQVEPADKFGEVADAIEEKHQTRFDNNEDGGGYLSDGDTKWSDMTKDMTELSKSFPGVTISMTCDDRDGNEWIEHYQDGKQYEQGRPNWIPEPFDASKLK